MRGRRGPVPLAVFALPLCLLSAVAWEGQAVSSRPPSDSAQMPSVVLTGELNGHITPCGCSKPMLGGLPRRATCLKSPEMAGALVRVEGGDLTEALGRQDELKAETIVEMLNLLDYDAIGLGENDFRLGLPYLRSLQARFKGAFLCANARGADGAALFDAQTLATHEVAGQTVRVGIVGLLSSQYEAAVQALNPDVHLEAPDAVLQRLQPDLSARSDVRILLYHGPKSEAEDLARQFPDFQLIVYVHEGDHPAEAQKVGPVMLACAGQDGKYVSRVLLAAKTGWPASDLKNQALTPDFADDPAVMQSKQVYLERVAAEDLLGKYPKIAPPDGDTYAGTAACAACHKTASAVWQTSGHAHAYRTLADEKEEKDPECVLCHVVGLAHLSGFASPEKTPHLEDVGCEACHGPAARHAQNPAIRLPKVGPAACQACHVPQHSPHFAFETYWPKIKHGREPSE